MAPHFPCHDVFGSGACARFFLSAIFALGGPIRPLRRTSKVMGSVVVAASPLAPPGLLRVYSAARFPTRPV